MQYSNNGETVRCFGYVRASTAAQDDSLELQRERIEAMARSEGWTLTGVFIDAAMSGGVPLAQRDEGRALLEAVQAGDVVIALKLDRMFRDTSDALTTLKLLRKRRVGLILKDLGSGDLTTNNVSALVFSLLSSVSDFERSRIAERIRDAKSYQRAQGRYLGGKIPFGYAKVERPAGGTARTYLEPISTIHAEAIRLRAQGYSTRLAAGHFASLGHQVSPSGVRALWSSIGL